MLRTFEISYKEKGNELVQNYITVCASTSTAAVDMFFRFTPRVDHIVDIKEITTERRSISLRSYKPLTSRRILKC